MTDKTIIEEDKPAELHKLFTEHVLTFNLADVSRCVLCNDPPCSGACPKNAPIGGILRSLYFENYFGAVRKLGALDCSKCSAPCEKSCVLSRDDIPIQIHQTFSEMGICRDYLPKPLVDKPDLSMDICGVRLENPFLLSSSVVASSYDMCRRAFEAGWAGWSAVQGR